MSLVLRRSFLCFLIASSTLALGCTKRIKHHLVKQEYPTSWLGTTPRSESHGYTISGLRTGLEINALLKHWKDRVTVEHLDNRYTVEDKETGTIVDITVDEQSKILAVDSVLQASIEVDGTIVLRQNDPIREVTQLSGVSQVETSIKLEDESEFLYIDSGRIVRQFRLVRKAPIR